MMTYEDALNRVAERTYENTQDIRRMYRQRRNQVVDIYGMEFTRQGDDGAPATFYISISPDMIYLERFEFKLIIQPFLSTTGATAGDASIIPSDYAKFEGDELILNYNTVKDPHRHSITMNRGQIHTTASDFLVHVEGIDVTPYLMAQYGGWIAGEGVYPSIKIGEDYDLLEAASDMCAENRHEDADKITRSGYKKVEVFSASPFQVTLVLYCKYSHCNR